ncbi:hypothetical protein [Hyphococcus sp.]|uniref:hypothetical protein n=1 Tax=Hyphococcus sp. TaxID=2038636 RepID=UPI00207E1EE0|nr:MAG: hypothetical protein DHS20C04_27310 [Marinicaulis sp.]
MSRAQIRKLEDKITVAKEKRDQYLRETYKFGDSIDWEIGRHAQSGHVERVIGDRLEVYNEKTGKTRFIYATDIL